MSDTNSCVHVSAMIENFRYPDSGAAVSSPRGSEGTALQDGPQKANTELPLAWQEEMARQVLQARAEGIQQGEVQARIALSGEVESARTGINDAIEKFKNERADYFARIESEVVQLALAIAAKILHREAQVDRSLLQGLVKVALENVHQSTKVNVRVRPEEVTVWREYLARNVGAGSEQNVTEDSSIEPGNCVLVTDLGSTQVGMAHQLKEIENGLFDLLAQRPDLK